MSIRRAVACSGRGPVSTTNFSGTGKDSAVPLDGALWIATQALRAWLLSACPSGTKGIGLSRASHQVSAYAARRLTYGRQPEKAKRDALRTSEKFVDCGWIPPVTELSTYIFEVLRKDEVFILYRGRSAIEASQLLVLSPVAEHPTPECLKQQ